MGDVDPDAPKLHALEGVDRELRNQERDVRLTDRHELGGLDRSIGRQGRRITRVEECGDVGWPDVGVSLAEPVGAEVVTEPLEELPVHVQVATGRILDERNRGRRRHEAVEDRRGGGGAARRPRVERDHGCVEHTAGQHRSLSDALLTRIRRLRLARLDCFDH